MQRYEKRFDQKLPQWCFPVIGGPLDIVPDVLVLDLFDPFDRFWIP